MWKVLHLYEKVYNVVNFRPGATPLCYYLINTNKHAPINNFVLPEEKLIRLKANFTSLNSVGYIGSWILSPFHIL